MDLIARLILRLAILFEPPAPRPVPVPVRIPRHPGAPR